MKIYSQGSGFVCKHFGVSEGVRILELTKVGDQYRTPCGCIALESFIEHQLTPPKQEGEIVVN